MNKVSFLAVIFAGFLWNGACTTVKKSPQAAKPDSTAAYVLTLPNEFNPDWANNSLWDDGMAEVAEYDATRIIYGKQRTFIYSFATTKEAFNKAYNVKTDDYGRSDLFDVIKLNMFARIETDNYPYHFLTSVFHKKGTNGALYKISQSSQEWCGNTFKEVLVGDQGINLAYHSYWDGEGDGELSYTESFIFEDQLPYLLRTTRFQEGLKFSSAMHPSLISSKVGKPVVSQAEFVVQSDTFTDSQGKKYDAWKVEISQAQKSTYWLDKSYPNTLLKMVHEDGRSLSLRSVRRWAYWQF